MGQGWRIPVHFNYTLTNTRFNGDFEDSFWADVIEGDKLPYIPSGQGQISLGLEKGDWAFNVLTNHVAQTRSTAGQGIITQSDSIDARWVFDASINFNVSDNVRIFATLDNLFDKNYVFSRRPYGARGGKPRSVFLGIEYLF